MTDVSVIIPTHQRPAALRRALSALCQQDYPVTMFEVLVVIDGPSNETTTVLRDFNAPFALRVLEQPRQGAAAARNRGANEAAGRWLIFLDDDIEAMPPLIEAHVAALQAGAGEVVIGYLPALVSGNPSFFQSELRRWWATMFEAMHLPWHRFNYRDLLSGNFSLAAELFHRVGEFDPSLQCHEDYELGARLLRAGARFTFVPAALGYHHESSDLHRALQRKYQEGIADIQLGRCYPELKPTLLLAQLEQHGSPLVRLLRDFAFSDPHGEEPMRLLHHLLRLLERTRQRRLWRFCLDAMLGFAYWRGVASVLETRTELAAFLHGISHQEPEDSEEMIELELAEGILAAANQLDEQRPAGARLFYGGHLVGKAPVQPGAEPLRGAHLHAFLSTTFDRLPLQPVAMESARSEEQRLVATRRPLSQYLRVLSPLRRFAPYHPSSNGGSAIGEQREPGERAFSGLHNRHFYPHDR